MYSFLRKATFLSCLAVLVLFFAFVDKGSAAKYDYQYPNQLIDEFFKVNAAHSDWYGSTKPVDLEQVLLTKEIGGGKDPYLQFSKGSYVTLGFKQAIVDVKDQNEIFVRKYEWGEWVDNHASIYVSSDNSNYTFLGYMTYWDQEKSFDLNSIDFTEPVTSIKVVSEVDDFTLFKVKSLVEKEEPKLVQLVSKPTNVTLDVSKSQNVTIEALYTDDSKKDVSNLVSWSTENAAIATVTDEGKVFGISSGVTNIRAELDGYSVTIPVTVNQKPEKVLTALTASSTKLSLKKGESQSVTVKGSYTDGSTEDLTSQVKWSSSNKKVALVTEGEVFAVGEGSSILTATYGDKSAVISVQVDKEGSDGTAIDHLEASEQDILLAPGKSLKLTAYAILKNGAQKNITFDKKTQYRSSSSSKVTIKPGLVKAGLSTGKAVITVTYEGKTLKIPVTVSKTTVKELNPSSQLVRIVMGAAESIDLMAELSDGSIKDVTELATWTTDDSTVAKVDRGEISGIAPGLASITAHYGGESVIITVEVVSEESELVGLEISDKNLKLMKGDEVELQVWANYADGTKEEIFDKITWQTRKRSVADVRDGVLTAVGAGKTTVIGNYKGKEVSISVEVLAKKTVKNLVLSKTSVTVGVKKQTQVKLTAIYTDGSKKDVTKEADWATKRDTIADVEDGTITGIKTGQTAVTAKYDGKVVSISVSVK